MKSLLAMMRLFHYMVGITAPPKEKERMVFYIWIGVVIGLALLAVLSARLMVPYILR